MSAARPQVRCQPILGDELARERRESRSRMATRSEAALERIGGREPLAAGTFLCGKGANNLPIWYARPNQAQQRGAE